ncbi:outer membrane chaperone Skp [Rufibacter radiotolerans]|uniref:Outer membrane chaperone Skp n=1 Tax=Rufibacter radiotolerans TaxID=1379910 RepID=A0A0H4VUC4_9BACT|nr:OmpH family outer membrane protein [Rufibacter radiotolerans]AKQ47537.1 outer membrane chaperone Skp [Rufibacter radiotolerans]
MNLSKNLLLLALVSASFAACKNDQASSTTKTATTATTATDSTASEADEAPVVVAAPEIVYINSDTLLSNYQYFKDVRARLEAKGKRMETDLRTKASSFQKEVEQYRQTGAGMTQEQRASTEQRLAQKEQQIAAQQQASGSQLAKDENDEMKKIYDKVADYLKKLSKEKGYKMVLTYSRGNSAILYGDSSLDITTEALSGLNEEYKATKKK